MATQARVFWQETVNMPATAGEPPSGQVDVAVIGGGITGLSAARTLARQGANVALLEAQTIGWGASSRNGGMVLTGLRLGVDVLLARYGRERARRMFNASLAAIDFIEQLIHEAQIDCDFARCGHLELACKPSHFRHFAHLAALSAKEFNHPLRLIEKPALSSEIGATLYQGGLVDELSAGVNPARYVAGLARAAQQAGAVLYDHAPVQQIGREGATYRVVTERGELAATQLFVATGGYTGRATPALQRKIFPVGSYIIVTEPLPVALAQELSPHNRMMFDAKNFLSYFRLTPDRRLLFGGRAAFYPETPARVRASVEITRCGLVAVFPQLHNVAIDYVWGGTVDVPFDRMPHAGQIDGLYYAIGYAGHGVAMATYLGDKVAATMGGAVVDNPFAEIPFPGAPLGLYDGRPWFLPLAEWWYRFWDWVG
ncbi:MAG: FAD-binding oxidoreductase [Caldilinea sp. CFX5]|nr:FAD-binding oxidoreductase [Caldilinea sp. CFX5]